MKQYQIYGLIGGVGIVLTSMVGAQFPSFRLFPIIFYIACIFLAIKKTKELELEGFLTVKNGVKIGVFTALIICIFYGIYVFIAATWEDPRPEINEMIKSGMKASEIEERLSYVTKSVLAQGAIIYSIFTFMVGFFTSVVAALFLKKSKGLIGQD